jgi:hypothetical protein
MVTKQAIDDALAAHSLWRKRLQDAIATGTSEFKPDTVKTDNNCQFGKWLNGLSGEDRKSADYSSIKALHADFHRIAGEVLELALSAKKAEAAKKIEPNSDYQNATGKLVIALHGWRAKL